MGVGGWGRAIKKDGRYVCLVMIGACTLYVGMYGTREEEDEDEDGDEDENQDEGENWKIGNSESGMFLVLF